MDEIKFALFAKGFFNRLLLSFFASFMVIAMVLIAHGLRLSLELLKKDRKNLLALMAVGAVGVVTGIIIAIIY